MKKYLIFTITLFLFIRVQAVTEKYSEWSSEYPTEISKLLIRKEDRYLWYKDVITDEEYIMKEKEVDRKWIPNTIEEIGEEAIQEVIKTLRKELEPVKLIQEIFELEKKENPEIF